MKKLLMILLLGMFMISFTSAFEFDNVKSYDEETRTVTITNALGLGDDVGGARLNTPLNFNVAPGYQKVAEFELWAYEDYNDIIKSIDMYDKNQKDWDKHKFDRNFDMKYRSYEDVEVYDYNNILTGYFSNGTAIYESQVVGSRIETHEVWNKVTPVILKKNEIVTVGIFTEVEVGDYVEWIPTIYGVEVEEWASWTAGLNVGLEGYYKLDNNNLSNAVSGLAGTNSGTVNGTGKIIDGRDFEAGDPDQINTNTGATGGEDLDFTGDFSICAWVNPESFPDTNNNIVGKRLDSGNYQYVFRVTSLGNIGLLTTGGQSLDTSATVTTGTYQFICVTRDSNGNTIFYYNGIAQDSFASNSISHVNTDTYIGGQQFAGSDWDGLIDEVGLWDRILTPNEINQSLYNEGNGNTYTNEFGASITLNSPIDYFNTTNYSMVFNTTVNEGGYEIVNVSLLINGIVNDTNTSGFSGDYIFENTLPIGDYNWSIRVLDNESAITNSSTRYFTISNIIENNQTYPTSSVEFATEIYTLNVTYDSSEFLVITSALNINGSSYLATRTGSGDNALFTSNVTMPSVETPTNFTPYWNVALTDVVGITYSNITVPNVTVDIINLTLCDAENNVSFWNFTILNETNFAEIGSTFEATFAVRNEGSTIDNKFSFSDTTGTNSTFDFCIYPGTSSYSADASIKLTKGGFVDKFYNYQDVSLSNATREDNLYMMALDDSTSFIVHVVYVDSSDVEGAEVQVQRYYQGTGNWETTEILTTNYVGEAVGHFLAEDADYRFLVYQGGVSVLNSSSTKITCSISPCTVTLTIPIDVPTGVETVEDLTSTLVYSPTTNVFTYTYSDTSGDLTQARLEVLRVFPSNATLHIPCNETKTDFSGVLTCDITGQVNGTYRASGYITRDSDEFLTNRIDGVLGNQIYNQMGEDGVLWGIFVLIGIIMLGVNRPSMSIIFGTIGLITLGLLQIINLGSISIIAIVAIAAILLMRIGRE